MRLDPLSSMTCFTQFPSIVVDCDLSAKRLWLYFVHHIFRLNPLNIRIRSIADVYLLYLRIESLIFNTLLMVGTGSEPSIQISADEGSAQQYMF